MCDIYWTQDRIETEMPAPTAQELLDKALKRRAELALESEALDLFIDTYKRLLSTRATDRSSETGQFELYGGASSRAINAAKVADMMDAARRLMIAEKRPMKRGELVKRLEAQGFEVTGKDKNKVFGTSLWRTGKFIAVEGKGYWPNDVELPR